MSLTESLKGEKTPRTENTLDLESLQVRLDANLPPDIGLNLNYQYGHWSFKNIRSV